MWTTEKEIKQALEKQWDKGIFLASLLNQNTLFPFKLKLSKPTHKDITDNFNLVRKWVEQLANIDFIQIEWKSISHRIQGEQKMPNAIFIQDLTTLLKVLKKEKVYQQFLTIIQQTESEQPILLNWLEKYPFKALSVAFEWQKILSVVAWIKLHLNPHIYLRQVDIPKIHTKFIEQHRAILTELFDVVLPENAINQAFSGVNNFIARYGFLEKNLSVRFRNLDKERSIFPNILQSDVTLDVESFAKLNPDIQRIIIVENETTYLSLPEVENTWAIWGAGYGWQALAQAKWLNQCEIFYWGDLDTHGFAILDRLRKHFPHTLSFLMDQKTLLNYPDFWSKESKPKTESLTRLTEDELQLYLALQHHQFGQNVRLEQEFIPFSVVKSAIEKMINGKNREKK
ncbi:Uncharacterized protein conserved in bacteria [Haemophilus parahaemolyticus]|uniref:Uncharacterized protein conserved in bacteria n=1 Tax=Haemophilus parahaemolyticus TaxID=735 RepID=A0A377HY68_HAEPH|nr:Wadjet anti-phage system protein JetD domain-containing protein [Haemophilus parahaemolyticus]STO63236.1 Uncharacterized protein conserved in bacteria [Haemophilus parahaemolyticus]